MQTPPEEKARLIEEFRQSGQSQKAFCRAKGITKSRLSYWLKKDREVSGSNGFIPVKTTDEAALNPEIIYPNGVKVVVPGGDLNLISRLIKLY